MRLGLLTRSRDQNVIFPYSITANLKINHTGNENKGFGQKAEILLVKSNSLLCLIWLMFVVSLEKTDTF